MIQKILEEKEKAMGFCAAVSVFHVDSLLPLIHAWNIPLGYHLRHFHHHLWIDFSY